MTNRFHYFTRRTDAAQVLADSAYSNLETEDAIDAAYQHLRFAEESRGDYIERNGAVVRVSVNGYSVRRA